MQFSSFKNLRNFHKFISKPFSITFFSVRRLRREMENYFKENRRNRQKVNVFHDYQNKILKLELIFRPNITLSLSIHEVSNETQDSAKYKESSSHVK